jgi:hypothetical protein
MKKSLLLSSYRKSIHDMKSNPKGIPQEINNKIVIVEIDVEFLMVGD